MKLLIVRHGPAGRREESAETGAPDRERPLTRAGREKTVKAAKGLAWAAPRPKIVLTSPLVRAKQTAKILADELGGPAPVEIEELGPSASHANLAARLSRRPKPVVALIGHEPQLSGFVSFLLTGGSGAALELKKAGACLLECDGKTLTPGRARLLWAITPAQLRRLARRN